MNSHQIKINQTKTKILISSNQQVCNLKVPALIIGYHSIVKLRSSLCHHKVGLFNCVLCGIGSSLTSELQYVQNAGARILTGLSRSDHITPELWSLHRLLIHAGDYYKILILVFMMRISRPCSVHQNTPSDQLLLEVPFSKPFETTSQAFSIRTTPTLTLDLKSPTQLARVTNHWLMSPVVGLCHPSLVHVTHHWFVLSIPGSCHP